MSYQYEYLDSSGYMEAQYQTEEYEAEHCEHQESLQQYNHQAFREEQHEQLALERDTNIEITEEQNVEIESSKLRFHNADILIQEELKEIICKKENEKTTLEILTEQKTNIVQQIESLQEMRNKLVEENDFLTMNTEIEKQEFLNLQKRVTYNGEIVGRLEQFMQTIKRGFEQSRVRSQLQMLNIKEHMKKVTNSADTHKINISKLNSDISAGKILRKADDPHPLKNNNLILKAEIIEQQTIFKNLQGRCQEVEEKRNYVNRLINERDDLKNELENRNSHLKELKEIRKKKEIDLNKLRTQMDVNKAEMFKRWNDAINTKEQIDAEMCRITEDKDNQCTILSQKEEFNSKLHEEICKIVELTKSRQLNLDELNQQYKSDIYSAQEKLKKVETEYAELNNENDELSCRLEQIKQEYMAKMEEKSNMLLKELEAEELLHLEEVLLTNIKLLEEQIVVKKKSPEELSVKIEKLKEDQSLEELNKKKAYLISSTDYLTEKLENTKKESEKINMIIKDIDDNRDNSRQINKEYQNRCEELQKELQDSKNVQEEHQQIITPTSILKSPLSHKRAPISPKKVKFEGLSSFESSSNSDGVTISGSQLSIVGKTFDDILEELHAESFKKPSQVPKKRKLDLE